MAKQISELSWEKRLLIVSYEKQDDQIFTKTKRKKYKTRGFSYHVGTSFFPRPCNPRGTPNPFDPAGTGDTWDPPFNAVPLSSALFISAINSINKNKHTLINQNAFEIRMYIFVFCFDRYLIKKCSTYKTCTFFNFPIHNNHGERQKERKAYLISTVRPAVRLDGFCFPKKTNGKEDF